MQKRTSNRPAPSLVKASHTDLAARIDDARALIGIIGMGYVGLPLMLACSAKKFHVLGFDIDSSKVKRLNSGKSPLKHIYDKHIAATRDEQLFEATDDLKRLSEVDVIVICVPTPVGAHREPDLSFVVDTAKAIAISLRRGQMVVLEFDDISRHDHRSCQAYSRIERSKGRSRLFLGVFARTRGSGKREILDIFNPKNCRR